MLSSVINDKPAASTWLDRLRLNRGLSTTNEDDASGNPLSLDDFLRHNHNHNTKTTASDSPPTPSDPELAESPLEDPPSAGEWYGVMSDVLSELFNFDGSSQSSTVSGKKKLPRKQSKPKHCSIETPNNVLPLLNQKIAEANCLPNVREFATSSAAVSEGRERRRNVAEGDGVDEEEEKDLVGFSTSEVTVIDTSFKIWKSEKLVFRRRNVWKVRDKKGKSRLVSSKTKQMKKKMKMKMKMKMKKKKKRKCEVSDGEIARKSKKMKMKISTSVPDNVPRYQIEDEPESSNINPRLSSKPRK